MKRVIITEEQLKQLVLNEYLDKEMMMPLKRLMTMSDEDKEDYLIRDFYYLSPDFIVNHVDLSELGYDDENEDSYEIAEDLTDRINGGDLKQYREGFINYIKAYLDSNYTEQPPFLAMDYIKDIHNGWLIHFSDNADSISDSGFVFGTDEFNSLSYSGCRTGNKFGQGYNFAYDVNDFEKYYRSSRSSAPKYGEGAVLFRASGIKVWHYGDEEYQVIFNGKTVNSVVYIRYNDTDSDCDWCIKNNRTGRIIVQDDNLAKLVKWYINNEAQYQTPVKGKKNQRVVFDRNREQTYKNKARFDTNYR